MSGLKNFTGILNFLVKQFNQFQVKRHMTVGEEFIIMELLFEFVANRNIIL